MSPEVILTVTKELPCLKLSECLRPDVTDERGMVKYEKNITHGIWHLFLYVYIPGISL